MPAKSQAQHGFFGLVRSVKEGRMKPEEVPASVRGKVTRAAKDMTRDQVRSYTDTPKAALPRRVGDRPPALRNVRSA